MISQACNRRSLMIRSGLPPGRARDNELRRPMAGSEDTFGSSSINRPPRDQLRCKKPYGKRQGRRLSGNAGTSSRRAECAGNRCYRSSEKSPQSSRPCRFDTKVESQIQHSEKPADSVNPENALANATSHRTEQRLDSAQGLALRRHLCHHPPKVGGK
jgi:hypothetical protein